MGANIIYISQVSHWSWVYLKISKKKSPTYKIISGKFYVCRPKFYLQIDPTINQKKWRPQAKCFLFMLALLLSQGGYSTRSPSVKHYFLKGKISQEVSLKVLFYGHLLKSFNLNKCNQIKPSSLLICNHFSRKVVLQTQIFFSDWRPRKKSGFILKVR